MNKPSLLDAGYSGDPSHEGRFKTLGSLIMGLH